MRCSACGAENRPGARFCNGCGAALAATCASCGQGNPPGSRFCDACGQSLTASVRPDTATIGALPASPTSYTPRHLAAKILAGRDALAGERKQVTVLFADVVGSTALIRDRDAEEAQRLLDGAVQRMMRAIHRYEGTVSRLMGDGLMAMFGAPVAHEDHAVRACYAALAMLEAVRDYAEETRQSSGEAIQIRVGINSGEVIVRLISDDLHMDYTAMGQTVHLASRMEGLAQAGTALLSPSALALAGGFVDVRPLGPMPVKGLDDPLPVYELIRAGAARTRLEAAAARGLTPFVGRDDERAIVDRALARTVSGHGQVVALVGEPGVGKSRLVYEVTRAATAADWLVLASGALAYGTATPYLPVVDLLKTYARIESGDDATTMRDRLAGRLLSLDPALDAILPPLLALLDLPVEDASWTALDPPRRRRATLDAIKRLLLRQSEEQPVLLVLEDLHWVDSETQALLDELVESVAGARLLLLVNYRPEYRHAWASKGVYTQARLDPLESGSAEQFLHSQLGVDEALIPLKQHLIERTGGIPLFLEESVRSLVETGVLVGQRGGYALTRDVGDVSVPSTVQVILAARIDRLDPEAKRLLQTAAVIGKDVPIDLLQAIADVGPGAPDDLHTILGRLQSAELLYPVRLFPEPEYTFKHALTHEVTYRTLLQERRRQLHGRVVDAIEQLYPGRLDEHLERLAHHALSSESWDKAEAYCSKAAEKAMVRTAYREAATWQERALRALAHLPESRETLERGVDLRLWLRNSLQPRGEIGRVLEHLAEAEILVERLGDQRRLSGLLTCMTNCHWLMGEHDRAIERGERAVAAAEAAGELPLLIGARWNLAMPYWGRGEYRHALARTLENLAAIEDGLLSDSDVAAIPGTSMPPAVGNRSNSAWYLAELGDFPRAVALGEEGVRVAEALGHAYSLTLALFHLGGVYLRRGDLALAIPALERSMGLCRAGDFRFYVPFAAARLGAAYTLAGRAAEGWPLLEEAVEQGERNTTRAEASLWTAWFAEVHLAADGLDEADRLAQSALDLATARNERANLAWARRLLGEIADRREPPEAVGAEGHFRQSLRMAEELGMRPLQAHCHLGLGRLYRRLGRSSDAHAELSKAVTMLREMGMAFWLPEAETELAQADGSVVG